ncbi:MAG: hypothetical protein Q7U54_13785 [Bacteroidales bacterium]|nr:hypothetical protein [Bacteroidales bacterium]
MKSLNTFTDKSVQVPEESGQEVLADFEQQFIPALVTASPVAGCKKQSI